MLEIVKKYGIDLEKLKSEQIKLSKNLQIKDIEEVKEAKKVGGIENIFVKNKIISAIVVVGTDFEIIDQKYFSDKIRFPYIPGFRAYRELSAMVSVFNLLEEKPSIVFIKGHGIAHPCRLGIASHFALVANVPTIGITDSLISGEVRENDMIQEGKIVGKVLITKKNGRPLYISPGNLVSVKTAVELVKKFVREPHRLPEPLRLARKYAKEVMKENI